jgi:hypothetical protein
MTDRKTAEVLTGVAGAVVDYSRSGLMEKLMTDSGMTACDELSLGSVIHSGKTESSSLS